MRNGIALLIRLAIVLRNGGRDAERAVVVDTMSSMFPDVSYLRQIADFTRMNDRALAEAARISRSVDLANARVAEVARRIEPFRAAIASVPDWEASLTARIVELKALPDHLEGFARLSRLSDAVHTAGPYSRPVRELVASELGVVVEADSYDSTPTRRDENAVKGGLNPELIAFLPAAYGEVLAAAGFKFCVPIPALQVAEATYPSGDFYLTSWALMTELEQRLRRTVKDRLSSLVGPNWIKHRVPEELRKKWLERQREEREAGRQVFDPIQYASFVDLEEVMRRKDNWGEAFEPIFRNKEDFLVSLRRLRPIRNAIAHSRPLSNSEVLCLVNEATRILSALKTPLVH